MLGCYPLFPLGWDGRPLAGEWDIRVTPGHNEDQLQTNLEICAKTKLVTFFFLKKERNQWRQMCLYKIYLYIIELKKNYVRSLLVLNMHFQ